MISRFTEQYRFLSNFYEYPMTYRGWLCPTAEHAYQASKSNDPVYARKLIKEWRTPGAAKRAGRLLLPLRPDWEEIKLTVMRTVLAAKFTPENTLGAMLLDTGDDMLVEGNTWGDRFWGVSGGSGANWLGHLLMARRAELREQDSITIAFDGEIVVPIPEPESSPPALFDTHS